MTERCELINRERRLLPHFLNVPVVGRVKIRVLLLARPTSVAGGYQEGGAGHDD